MTASGPARCQAPRPVRGGSGRGGAQSGGARGPAGGREAGRENVCGELSKAALEPVASLTA